MLIQIRINLNIWYTMIIKTPYIILLFYGINLFIQDVLPLKIRENFTFKHFPKNNLFFS